VKNKGSKSHGSDLKSNNHMVNLALKLKVDSVAKNMLHLINVIGLLSYVSACLNSVFLIDIFCIQVQVI